MYAIVEKVVTFQESLLLVNASFRRRHVFFVGLLLATAPIVWAGQGFMQDENVACHDIGKLSFEHAVGCFGTPQLERATHFPMPQLDRATCFAMPQLDRATRFPNVPSRVATRFRMFQFEHE